MRRLLVPAGKRPGECLQEDVLPLPGREPADHADPERVTGGTGRLTGIDGVDGVVDDDGRQ